jgi:hypothetical protein
LALEGGALNAQLAWGQQARTAMAFVGHGGGFDPRITDPSGDQTDSNEIPIDGAGITADYVDPTVLDPRITDPPGNEIDPAEVSALGHVDNGGTVDPAQDPTDQPVNKQNVFPSTIGDPIFEARHMDPRITDPADVIDSQDEGLNNSILEKAVE